MLVILIGLVMMGLTVSIHAIGAAHWLVFLGNWVDRSNQHSGSSRVFLAVVGTATVLLFLHLLEIILWALLYVALPAKAGLTDFSEAVYFSVVTFTTLGYGDVTLNADWRLLDGMEAMVGIAVFGLTTAILFAVIQKAWIVVHKG